MNMPQEYKPNGYAVIVLFIGAIGLLAYPSLTLLAEHDRIGALSVLEDPASAYREMLDISAETIPAYREAIDDLKRAAAFRPRPSLLKMQADLYLRLGKWADAMENMGEQVPTGALTKDEALAGARASLAAALSMEPFNPDYHLALGELNDLTGTPADDEYRLAVLAAPYNAALRYLVALRQLNRGKKAEALQEARALAAMDDSYVLPESPAKQLMMERRTPEYLSVLARSYLFMALEVAWRASDKDISLVKKMVPDSKDAQEVLRVFLESKGIDQTQS